MTGILEGDIKFLASAVMADTTDGGGRKTGTVITTGQHNAIFPDLSSLDQDYGRVKLRELFMGIETDSRDVYYGANIIVLTPPDNENVIITLFETGGHFDTRVVARDYIESYLAKGPKWMGYLYDTQLKGQRAIRLFQRKTIRLPEVGETLMLIGNPGSASQYEQYVRITGVSSVDQEFFVEGYGQPFVRTVVTCEISAPLQHSFEGNQPTPYDSVTQVSQLRETVVADAAKYYGTKSLAQAAQFGSRQCYVSSIFTQLVPASRVETAAGDLTAGGQVSTLTPADNGDVTFSYVLAFGPGRSVYLGTAAQPGTVSITIGAAVIKDAGGEIWLNGTSVGTIDYQQGLITANNACPDYGTTTKTVKFKPAGSITRIADTMAIAITESTRGYAYALTLSPIPDPGSLTLSFYSQGKWYDLKDNGKGELYGADSGYGSGQINFTTGTLLVTLGALPDTGSALLLSWGAPTTSFNRADTVTAKVGISGVLGSTFELNATSNYSAGAIG